MKTEFTELQETLITIICSLYGIQVVAHRHGVFTGVIPGHVRISLNSVAFMKLLNTNAAVYIEMRNGTNTLAIIH